MVPACRTAHEGVAIPQLAMDHRDVESFLHELQGFHDAFRDCFARSEPRDHVLRDMVGQFSGLERQSIEPMALRVEGGNVRAMPRRMRSGCATGLAMCSVIAPPSVSRAAQAR